MIWLLAAAMASACASNTCADAAAPVAVAFEPLSKREQAAGYQSPVGPYFPQAAFQRRVGGFAILKCRVAAGGALKKCSVVEESPSRMDFGAAARIMALRKHIKAALPYVEGEELQVRVPFEFPP